MKKFKNILKVILGLVIIFVVGYFIFTIGKVNG